MNARTIAVVAAIGLAVGVGVWTLFSGEPAPRWSVQQAQSAILRRPPTDWSLREWNVVWATCDGIHPRPKRTRYTEFSCEITVVKPSLDCRGAEPYECVAAYQATALTRQLRVLSRTGYTLSPS